MPIVYEKLITRDLVRRHPNVLFVFGDNFEGRGLGGQAAAMRGEPNAVGIPTKRRPSMADHAFLDDSDYARWYDRASGKFKYLQHHLRKNGIVVIPKDGIGTGLAQLEQRAPLIWSSLSRQMSYLNSIKAETPESRLADTIVDVVAERAVNDLNHHFEFGNDHWDHVQFGDERWDADRIVPVVDRDAVIRSMQGYLETVRERGVIVQLEAHEPFPRITWEPVPQIEHIRITAEMNETFRQEIARALGMRDNNDEPAGDG